MKTLHTPDTIGSINNTNKDTIIDTKLFSNLSIHHGNIYKNIEELLQKLEKDTINYHDLLQLGETINHIRDIALQKQIIGYVKHIYQKKYKGQNSIIINDILPTSQSSKNFQKLVEKYGYNVDNFHTHIDHHDTNNNISTFISINFPIENIKSIIESGYHSGFMNNAQTGAIHFNKRLAIEYKYKFLYKDTVYGSLCNNKNDRIWGGATLSMNTIGENNLKPYSPYGAPFLKLKNHCTQRCTGTLGDTGSENFLLRRDDCIRAKKLQEIMREDKKLTNQLYIDMQVHGGIGLEDIDSVNYPLFSLYNENINYDDITLLYTYCIDKVPLHINIPKKLYNIHKQEIDCMKQTYPKAIFVII